MKHQRKTGGLQRTDDLGNKISNLITKSKEKYYPRNKSKLKTFLSISKTSFRNKKVPIYLCFSLIIDLLPIFKKERMFLTIFLQNNARRLQAVVYFRISCIYFLYFKQFLFRFICVYFMLYLFIFYAALHGHSKVMRYCFWFLIVLFLLHFHYC